MTQGPRRGGRKGQSHTATPRLRAYDTPPASEVTVTRADGSTYKVPAQKPRPAKRPARRRGPLICAACGHPIDKDARKRTERGKPAHATCPTPEARPVSAPAALVVPAESELWAKVTCPRCQPGPGNRCVLRTSGKARTPVTSETPHQERVQLVHRVLAAQKRRPANALPPDASNS